MLGSIPGVSINFIAPFGLFVKSFVFFIGKKYSTHFFVTDNLLKLYLETFSPTDKFINLLFPEPGCPKTIILYVKSIGFFEFSILSKI